MLRNLLVLSVALLLAFLSGCGDDDADSSTTADTGVAESEASEDTEAAAESEVSEAAAETEEGEVATDAASRFPEFPIPVAPGATRVNPAAADQLQAEYPEGDFEAVVAFYDDWTEGQGSSFERFEGADGSVGWRNDLAQGEGFRAISVSFFEADADVESVTVAILVAR